MNLRGRLKALIMFSLQKRRERYALSYAYKMVIGPFKIIQVKKLSKPALPVGRMIMRVFWGSWTSN